MIKVLDALMVALSIVILIKSTSSNNVDFCESTQGCEHSYKQTHNTSNTILNNTEQDTMTIDTFVDLVAGAVTDSIIGSIINITRALGHITSYEYDNKTDTHNFEIERTILMQHNITLNDTHANITFYMPDVYQEFMRAIIIDNVLFIVGINMTSINYDNFRLTETTVYNSAMHVWGYENNMSVPIHYTPNYPSVIVAF